MLELLYGYPRPDDDPEPEPEHHPISDALAFIIVVPIAFLGLILPEWLILSYFTAVPYPWQLI